MWQTKTPAQYKALRALGVTAAMVQANRSGETPADAQQKVAPIVAARLQLYVENIATDFYSAYHRWFPDRPKNAEYLAVQRAIAADQNDKSAFVRKPSLSDARALGKIEKRLTDTVRIYAPYRPLYFDLGDETGIADLSAAWDFDFSASSLSGMRAWLKEQYGTLAALNREWGTHFMRWQDVVPSTTTEAMARSDENYASWSDFKAWMDVAYARAVAAGTKAVHAGAPWALAGIEGAQMPGWGGYDYSRLAPAVDVMEIYDSGDNVEIAQSFNPRLVIVTTSTWAKPDAEHQAWREFLRGARAMALWDGKDQFVNPDGSLGPRGKAASAFFSAAHRGPARLLLASERHRDPVAVLYSPASFRVQWMLDHRALGAAWTQRSASDENEDAVRAARRRTLLLLSQLGFTPGFVSDEQIAHGLLTKGGYKVLILPQALALSGADAEEIRAFVRAGGFVVADGDAGTFDGHGRRLMRPLLWDLLNARNDRAAVLPDDGSAAKVQLGNLLTASGLVATARIGDVSDDAMPDVEQYVFRNGEMTLVALLAKSTAEDGDRVARVALALPHLAYAYNARSGALLGRTRRLELNVERNSPTIVALSARPLSPSMRKSRLDLDYAPEP